MLYLGNKREQITATCNKHNMDRSHRHNAEQTKPTQNHVFNLGPLRSRCQNATRQARDLLREKPGKMKGRGSRNRLDKPSNPNAGLKLVRGGKEGKTEEEESPMAARRGGLSQAHLGRGGLPEASPSGGMARLQCLLLSLWVRAAQGRCGAGGGATGEGAG